MPRWLETRCDEEESRHIQNIWAHMRMELQALSFQKRLWCEEKRYCKHQDVSLRTSIDIASQGLSVKLGVTDMDATVRTWLGIVLNPTSMSTCSRQSSVSPSCYDYNMDTWDSILTKLFGMLVSTKLSWWRASPKLLLSKLPFKV